MTSDRLYPTRPILAASVAVIRDGRVLLAARGKPPWEGAFSLPGGQVETGETMGEAALRELQEEVGVKAKLIGLVAPVEVIEREADGRVKHHLVIAAHAARWVSGEPQTGPEAKEIRWVTERDIAALQTTPGLAGILEQAFRLEREDAAR
ncbi:NUDIX hydrolase [Microvirga sp. GCM10011540]|uniref:NUDIX hydrolase n=1 Tax=Microvirga sp. GCM10011540 TaxID=3317338 RepID=UPI00360FACBE